MEDFTAIAEEAADILETVENYQWKLGELADFIVTKYGNKALPEFANQIEAISGVRRSPVTLRLYAHVWKMSTKLGLPRDILFSACSDIVFSDNPKKYAKMAKEGASGTDIRKQIAEDKIK